MVGVLMREQDFCDLLRLVAEVRQRFHIAADVFTGVQYAILIGDFLGCSCRDSRVYQNHLIASVN